VSTAALRIGYALGAPTSILLRAKVFGDFKRAGVPVELYAKSLRGQAYEPISEYSADGGDKYGAKATGGELIAGLLAGRWELATVGDGSFLEALAQGQPIVAVAELGHDVKGASSHGFALRRGVVISKPGDYMGKLLASRRAGPSDAVLLLEYLEQAGLDLARDSIEIPKLPATAAERAALPKDKLTLVHGVYEDDLRSGVESGIIDGGFVHIGGFERGRDRLTIVKPLDAWADPSISNVLLVCRRDFLRDAVRRRQLKLLLKAYMGRIRYEKSLPSETRRYAGKEKRWLRMDGGVQGLSMPQYDDLPRVDLNALHGMLTLLRKHRRIDGKPFELEGSVDDGLLREAALEPAPSGSPGSGEASH
jgi:hypothetical protein